mmetsp:Transcript_144827/g.204947  ORF Transcript_144827/g.204947 Transcript_144827/m.204947 type:complete len:313 (+) Transcript_144827:44-982(+)
MGGSQSVANPAPVFNRAYPHFKHFIEVGPGLWNYNTDFYVAKVINIHTHMSVAELSNGNMVAIDAAKLSKAAKAELDELTANGDKLVACLNTHPFHTVAIPAFHAAYPATEKRRYIGCPRHIRKITEDAAGAKINWSANFLDADVLNAFSPDLEMRIPDGAEFDDPKPPSKNHFSNVFVFHPKSKTVVQDDTVMYIRDGSVVMRAAGLSPGTMKFHTTLTNCGLYKTKEAPLQFMSWFEKLLADWDFEHLISAHTGPCYTVGKEKAKAMFEEAKPILKELSEKNAQEASNPKQACEKPVEKSGSDDGNCECG